MCCELFYIFGFKYLEFNIQKQVQVYSGWLALQLLFKFPHYVGNSFAGHFYCEQPPKTES